MTRYKRTYRSYSGQRQPAELTFADYYSMEVNVSKINYELFKYVSIFAPEYSCEVIKNQIHIKNLASILANTSTPKDFLKWDELLQQKEYKAPKPQLYGLLPEPKKPDEPTYNDIEPQLIATPEKPIYFKPNIKFQFLRNLFPKAINMIEDTILKKFELNYNLKKLSNWEKKLKEVEMIKKKHPKYDSYQHELDNYKFIFAKWENAGLQANIKLNEANEIWLKEKEKFYAAKKNENDYLIKLRNEYSKKNKAAIEKVTSLILQQSSYPDLFPKNFIVNYDAETGIIIIDFQLPDFERFKIVDDTKRLDFKEISQSKRKSILEASLHAIAIRTLYEIASTDKVNAIISLVFNGWVNFIDKKNGNERNAYILSVHATKKDINNLVIENIDPKECFKALKGIVAKNILEYIPVAPILLLNKNDNRIIEGRNIIDGLSSEDNLAAMDWNDFEHLIRELFEKVFSESGAEVKITHASHDRGVDAIIYDPDPIRGGKFIIQAKRYTKLVDVSAVRDLYGTIQNEGANRGILVTTSHFGPDAYEFAKNKNITLITGENLLHLLQKHGYQFRIDVKEARKLLNLK